MMIRSGAILAYETFKNISLMATNKLPKIERMVFEVTDACNSRCRHCNIWKSEPTKNLLTPEEIKILFGDELFKDLEYIIITGGECFLRKDLEDVILSIHEVLPDTRMTLSTNGLMPKRVINVVETAIKNNVCIDVGVSLDGIGKKHDSIRGVDDNFKKVDYLLHELSSLKEKQDNKFTVTIAHTLSKLTADSLVEVAAYAQKGDLDFLTQMCEEFSYYSNLEHFKKTDNNVKQIKAMEQLPASFHNEILLKALRRNKPINFRCYSMKTFFLLRCNGDIAPCLRYSNIKAGNIREHSPSEIWQSQAARETRALVKNCEGCSNTWATSWSFNEWFPPFFNVLIRYKAKKEIARFKGNGVSNTH